MKKQCQIGGKVYKLKIKLRVNAAEIMEMNTQFGRLKKREKE